MLRSEVDVQRNRVVNPGTFGDPAQPYQGAQGNAAEQGKAGQFEGHEKTAHQEGNIAGDSVEHAYLPIMPGILNLFSTMPMMRTTVRPRIR